MNYVTISIHYKKILELMDFHFAIQASLEHYAQMHNWYAGLVAHHKCTCNHMRFMHGKSACIIKRR